MNDKIPIISRAIYCAFFTVQSCFLPGADWKMPQQGVVGLGNIPRVKIGVGIFKNPIVVVVGIPAATSWAKRTKVSKSGEEPDGKVVSRMDLSESPNCYGKTGRVLEMYTLCRSAILLLGKCPTEVQLYGYQDTGCITICNSKRL